METREYKPRKAAGSVLGCAPVDPARCRAGVWDTFHREDGQCSRAPVVAGKWCRQHDPERRKAAEEEGRREHERQLYRRMTPYRVAQRVEQERDIYETAVKSIATMRQGQFDCAMGYDEIFEAVRESAQGAMGAVAKLRELWAAEDAEALK